MLVFLGDNAYYAPSGRLTRLGIYLLAIGRFAIFCLLYLPFADSEHE